MSRDFNPAFDTPRDADQALAVLLHWGEPNAMTFSWSRAAVAGDLIEHDVCAKRGEIEDLKREVEKLRARNVDLLAAVLTAERMMRGKDIYHAVVSPAHMSLGLGEYLQHIAER